MQPIVLIRDRVVTCADFLTLVVRPFAWLGAEQNSRKQNERHGWTNGPFVSYQLHQNVIGPYLCVTPTSECLLKGKPGIHVHRYLSLRFYLLPREKMTW